MSKKFNIHEWQAKQRYLETKKPKWLAEQDDYQRRQDRLTPGKNPEEFYGSDSPFSQESMSNADIRALQTVVGEYSLNKILNTIAVIADRMGKNDEADMVKKLANQIQDFDPSFEPGYRGNPMNEAHGLDKEDIETLETLINQIEQGTINSKKIKDFVKVLQFVVDSNVEVDQTKDLSKNKELDELNMTGTGASFNAGPGMGHFGKKKKKVNEEEEEELSRDVKTLEKLLNDRINTKDEWIDMFQLLMSHSEEISALNASTVRSLLQQSMKEL